MLSRFMSIPRLRIARRAIQNSFRAASSLASKIVANVA
jgi:hypothetical protein